MPEEQVGAVYGAGDGSYALINYATEKQTTTVSLPGASSSVFISRDQRYVFAANQTAHTLTVQDRYSGHQLWVESAQRLPRLHQSQRFRRLGLRAEQQPGLQRSISCRRTSRRPPMRRIANRKTCPCIACCPWPGTFDRPTKAVFSADGTTALCTQLRPGVRRHPGQRQLPAGRRDHHPERCAGTARRPTAVTATVPIPGGDHGRHREWKSLVPRGAATATRWLFCRVPLYSRYQRASRSQVLTPSAMGRI